MSNLYAMRRPNGDWFTLDDDGKLLVPIFHSSHDALMARLRTVEMLAFSPLALELKVIFPWWTIPSRVLNAAAHYPTRKSCR